MRKCHGIYVLLLLFITSTAVAQEAIQPDSPKYEQLKKEGNLDINKLIRDLYRQARQSPKPALKPDVQRTHSSGNQTTAVHAQCHCMVPIDATFSVVPFTNGTAPDYRNDDGSSPLITLPFSFCLYGTTYTNVYINNNGNISFNAPYFTYSANGFPDATHAMVAPFWADVDTRINFGSGSTLSGLVYYKVTPTSLIVQWDSVGYFNAHDDLLNTFQLIITDGTDPILPPGNNVDFCYGDMDWTTGDASQGVNGYGGTPATVGANNGNGTDFIQFGRFDSPGYGYDGPFGAVDSVDFLDNQNFIFNTCLTGGATNIPPIVHGLVVCDTIVICADDPSFSDTIPITLDFLSPEQGQITTITTSFIGPGIFTVLNNTPGPIAHIDAQIILNGQSVGINSATFIATDNGTPPATDSLNVAFKIDTFPLAPPVITGSHYYCVGGSGVTLSVGNIYNSYLWNTGVTGVDTLHVMTGTYNVEVTNSNGCRAKAPAFPVWEIDPYPIIGGVTAVCGQASAQLTTLQHYASYHWSTNSTDSLIYVGTGTYTVTVTDAIGCSSTSSPLNVVVHPNPTALFSYSPEIIAPGDTVYFTDISTAGSGNIVGWHWDFGDGSPVSNQQNPTHVYATSEGHPVSLTVTQSDGCTNTYDFTIEPGEVVASNIITPNNDGKNDAFVFQHLEFYDNSKLEIFNRWGRKVYENNNYQNDWKGGDLVDGVYFYVLKITDKEALKGTVTIKR